MNEGAAEGEGEGVIAVEGNAVPDVPGVSVGSKASVTAGVAETEGDGEGVAVLEGVRSVI